MEKTLGEVGYDMGLISNYMDLDGTLLFEDFPFSVQIEYFFFYVSKPSIFF